MLIYRIWCMPIYTYLAGSSAYHLGLIDSLGLPTVVAAMLLDLEDMLYHHEVFHTVSPASFPRRASL